jgi:hypothetical protein
MIDIFGLAKVTQGHAVALAEPSEKNGSGACRDPAAMA